MKKVITLGIALSIFFCKADRQHEDYLRAQQLAANNQFQEAVILYDTMMHPGFNVFYNKGICLYKMGKYVQAFCAFKKAYTYATRTNYKDVKTALHESAHKGGFEYKTNWKNILYETQFYIPLLVIQIGYLLLVMLLAWYILYKPFSYKSSVLITVGLLYTVYVGLMWRISTRFEGVIIVPAHVYTGPGREYQAYTSFAVGTVVNVDKKEKSWYKVKGLQNSGWVEDTTVHIIKE